VEIFLLPPRIIHPFMNVSSILNKNYLRIVSNLSQKKSSI
jgi:hypothetical protein